MIPIRKFKVKEKFIRKSRWHVRLVYEDLKKTMPQANYNWLKGNPIFSDVPKGYVIHHLDLDPTNDDVSNLALMSKHHHTAFHWKQKNIKVPLILDKINGLPISKPKIYYRGKSRNCYYISYDITDENDQKKTKYICNIDGYGKTFKTHEEAEEAIKVLWPGCRWD